MQFLKAFGLLLLLTLGNVGIASANSFPPPQLEEDQVEFQFIEDLQDLSESTLITPAKLNQTRPFSLFAFVPGQLCPAKISRTRSYLVYSLTIVPSLDTSDIIFPFHSFL